MSIFDSIPTTKQTGGSIFDDIPPSMPTETAGDVRQRLTGADLHGGAYKPKGVFDDIPVGGGSFSDGKDPRLSGHKVTTSAKFHGGQRGEYDISGRGKSLAQLQSEAQQLAAKGFHVYLHWGVKNGKDQFGHNASGASLHIADPKLVPKSGKYGTGWIEKEARKRVSQPGFVYLANGTDPFGTGTQAMDKGRTSTAKQLVPELAMTAMRAIAKPSQPTKTKPISPEMARLQAEQDKIQAQRLTPLNALIHPGLLLNRNAGIMAGEGIAETMLDFAKLARNANPQDAIRNATAKLVTERLTGQPQQDPIEGVRGRLQQMTAAQAETPEGMIAQVGGQQVPYLFIPQAKLEALLGKSLSKIAPMMRRTMAGGAVNLGIELSTGKRDGETDADHLKRLAIATIVGLGQGRMYHAKTRAAIREIAGDLPEVTMRPKPTVESLATEQATGRFREPGVGRVAAEPVDVRMRRIGEDMPPTQGVDGNPALPMRPPKSQTATSGVAVARGPGDISPALLAAEQAKRTASRQPRVTPEVAPTDSKKVVKSTAKSADGDYHISTGEGFKLVADAKPTTIPGFEGLDFFIHKDGKNGWAITEGRSGLKIATGMTRSEALKRATEKLNDAGLDALERVVAQATADRGVSPRHTGKYESSFKVGDKVVHYGKTDSGDGNIYGILERDENGRIGVRIIESPYGNVGEMHTIDMGWHKSPEATPRVKPRPPAPKKQMPMEEGAGSAAIGKVRIAGAEFELMAKNPDGTITVRNEQGDVWDTNVGEPYTELATAQKQSRTKTELGTEEEFIATERRTYEARMQSAVNEAEAELARVFPSEKTRPVGISRTQWALAQKPKTSEQRSALANYRRVVKNRDVPFDEVHTRNVYKRMRENPQPTPRTPAPKPAPVDAAKPAVPTRRFTAEQQADAAPVAPTEVESAHVEANAGFAAAEKAKSAGKLDEMSATLESVAEAAMERIRKRGNGYTMKTGIDPFDLADATIYTAAKIAKGMVDSAAIAKHLTETFGKEIGARAKQIYEDAVAYLKSQGRDVTGLAWEEPKRANSKTALQSIVDRWMDGDEAAVTEAVRKAIESPETTKLVGDQRRGILNGQSVHELAKQSGLSAEALQSLKPGTALGPEHIEKAVALLESQKNRWLEKLTAGDVEGAAIEQGVLQSMYARFAGVSAEWGRSGQALRRMKAGMEVADLLSGKAHNLFELPDITLKEPVKPSSRYRDSAKRNLTIAQANTARMWQEHLKSVSGPNDITVVLAKQADFLVKVGYEYAKAGAKTFADWSAFMADDIARYYGERPTQEQLHDLYLKTKKYAESSTETLAEQVAAKKKAWQTLKNDYQKLGIQLTDEMKAELRSIADDDIVGINNFVLKYGKQIMMQKEVIRRAKLRLKQTGREIPESAIEELKSLDPQDTRGMNDWLARNAPMTMGTRLARGLIDTLNFSRTTLTSGDISATFRQGAFLGLGHPVQYIRAMRKYGALLKSDAGFKSVMDEIKSRPSYEAMKEAGVFMGELDGKHTALEEAFMSRVANRIPGVRMSARAYIGFLNALRADVFDRYHDFYGDTIPLHQYKQLGKVINAASGRGRLGALEEAGTALSTVFFSPRFFASRLQVLLDPIQMSGPARVAALRNLVGFTSATMGLMYMAKLSGASVETDPRSSDWGKARWGKFRLDLTAGIGPIVRYTARFITKASKDTETGRLRPTTRSSTVSQFARSKLAPAPGFAVDLIAERTFIGEKMQDRLKKPGVIIYESFTPMNVQDFWDGYTKQNLATGLAAAVASTIGLGAQTYDPWDKTRKPKKSKQPSSGMSTTGTSSFSTTFKPVSPKKR